MDEGLLHFLVPGQAHLRILTVESTLYLPGLHELLPQAELYAVTRYEEIPELPQFSALPVKWQRLDFRKEELPYSRDFFDYILSEDCLENSLEPLETATKLGRLLKETGQLLTAFSNIRYWRILEQLRTGHFFAWDRHLFAKPEVVRLLNDALYKEIVFSPLQQDAKEQTEMASWLEFGFENYQEDLATEVWLVRAARSTAEVAALKDCYTKEVRSRLAVLLHRIEYDIDREENLAALWRYCEEQMIFPAYLLGFIQEAVSHKEEVLRVLEISARKTGKEDFLAELA